MMPWFYWKGESSLDYGLWVSELPAPRKAPERVEELTVPGRPGTLHVKEGDNVHEGYARECTVTAKAGADFAAILTWLSGDGEVIFSNEPDRAYDAQIFGEVQFTRSGNALKKATIPFFVHPHKRQYPPESPVAMTADGSIRNPGTVASRPLVQITFTGTCTVSIGGEEMTFTAKTEEGETPAEETIYVDCDAQIITDDGGIWEGSSAGGFWTLEPGENAVALTDAEIVITPRWRWY